MNKGGFSWARLLGLSNSKSKASRYMGVPLTKGGRERKLGRMKLGKEGWLLLLISMFLD